MCLLHTSPALGPGHTQVGPAEAQTLGEAGAGPQNCCREHGGGKG